MSNSFIWSIDRNLLDATTPGQSVSGNNSNEGVLSIPQSFNMTGGLLSGCLIFISRTVVGGGGSLQRCSWRILQPQPTGLSIYILEPSAFNLFLKMFCLFTDKVDCSKNYFIFTDQRKHMATYMSLKEMVKFFFTNSKVSVFNGIPTFMAYLMRKPTVRRTALLST